MPGWRKGWLVPGLAIAAGYLLLAIVLVHLARGPDRHTSRGWRTFHPGVTLGPHGLEDKVWTGTELVGWRSAARSGA